MEIVIPPFATALYDNETGSPIVKYPHPVLRKVAEPVSRVTKDIPKMIDKMIQIMKDANGVGLAAPQIGVSLRVIVIGDPEQPVRPIINPVIVEKSEETEKALEGCLSIPALFGDVDRATRVVVTGLNRWGKPTRAELTGFAARIAQHEVDHLDGILFTDKVELETVHWSLPDSDDDEEIVAIV